MSCGGVIGTIVGFIWLTLVWVATLFLLIIKLGGEVNYSWFWVIVPLGIHYGILVLVLLIKHIIFIKRIWNNQNQSERKES